MQRALEQEATRERNHHAVSSDRRERTGADSRERLYRLSAKLPGQPIFYPVLFKEYAVQIARDWNARNGNIGYVTRFQVQSSFLSRYEVHTVGSSIHKEYWIPAEDLEEFNRNIVGKIEVIAEFHDPTTAEGTRAQTTQ